MEFPEKLKYTKDHEWISSDSGQAKVGVSQYAIEQLGDIVFVELPEVGAELTVGESFGTIESTKTVSDLYAPGSGKVIAINENLLKEPEKLQNDPYNEGWLVKVELNQSTEATLMDAKSYEDFIKES